MHSPYIDICSRTIKNPNHLPLKLPLCPKTSLPAPPFLGKDYFCRSGHSNNGESSSGWYLGDPLWDSKGYHAGSVCCSHGGRYRTTHCKEKRREKKTAANRTRATSRSIADPLAAEPWSLPASINPFPPYVLVWVCSTQSIL